MFERINIQLTGPICACPVQNLLWNTPTVDGKSTLSVWCGTCGIKILVPNNAFMGGFALKVPYPGKPAVAVKPALKVLDGGKVIPINPLGDPSAAGLV